MTGSIEIKVALSDEDILKCREVMMELRPHLDPENFVHMVKEMISEGYKLAFIEEDNKAVAVIGFRYLQFLSCGKHFYIDDLSTLPACRGKGYAGLLLDHLTVKARAAGYELIALDSGYHRADAHRLYLNKGFTLSSHHFSRKI